MRPERPDDRARRARRPRPERQRVRRTVHRTPPAPAPESIAEPAPRRPWHRRPIVLGFLALILVVGVGLLAWFTPLMSVRNTEVVGANSIPREQVRLVLAIPAGQPLMQVDTGAAAQRVAGIPKVASARVQRIYPSTIQVTVTERVPVVFVDAPDGTHLLDGGAVDYEVAPPPPGVPRLVTPTPVWGDPATDAALEVLASMPPQLRGQVGEVAARSISDISVTLHDGRVVVWGGTEKSNRKAAVTLPLLTQPGTTFDVSSPDLPTVR